MLALLKEIVDKTLKMGADEVEIYAGIEKTMDALIQKNDIDTVKSDRKSGAGIRVFKSKALGFAYTNNLSREALLTAAEDAVRIARASQPDEFNELPEPEEVKEVKDLYDKQVDKLKVEDVVNYSLDMLDIARKYDERISVDRAGVHVSCWERYIVNSKGINLHEKGTAIYGSILGMAREGEKVSSMDYEWLGSTQLKDFNYRDVVREFAASVIGALGAKKGESFKGEMLITPFAGLELICLPIVNAINAENVHKGISKFRDKLDKRVASDFLTIIDDGTIPGALGSGAFDREGVPHRPLTIIENGILRSFIYNTYSAKREGKKSTGHASGGARSVPSIDITNFIIKEGDVKKDDLIKEMKKGVIVKRFSGNVNPVTGEFSGVVKCGYLVKDGEVVQPLIGTMIQGNVFDMLMNITGISKEKKTIFNYSLPYIRVKGVSVTSG